MWLSLLWIYSPTSLNNHESSRQSLIPWIVASPRPHIGLELPIYVRISKFQQLIPFCNYFSKFSVIIRFNYIISYKWSCDNCTAVFDIDAFIYLYIHRYSSILSLFTSNVLKQTVFMSGVNKNLRYSSFLQLRKYLRNNATAFEIFCSITLKSNILYNVAA